jgi:hypothetical protein
MANSGPVLVLRTLAMMALRTVGETRSATTTRLSRNRPVRTMGTQAGDGRTERTS